MSKKILHLDDFTESIAGINQYNKSQSGTNFREHKKMISCLNNVIDGELTPRQKICFILYYGEMKKMNEISKELGIGISSVSRHIKKAKNKIQRTMLYYYS